MVIAGDRDAQGVFVRLEFSLITRGQNHSPNLILSVPKNTVQNADFKHKTV